MSFLDYCKQLNDGQITIVIDNLPINTFIDAIKIRDIYKVTILGRQSRKGVIAPGAGDVKLLSTLGQNGFITRKQLASEFVHVSGRKIALATLKNDKPYIVMRHCEERYKAMKLPDNCTGLYKNNKVNNGSYIVAKVDANGNIDHSTLAIISSTMFRKMFKIPMQSIIKKYINKPNKSKNLTVFNRQRHNIKQSNSNSNYTNNSMNPRINLADIGINPSNISIGRNTQNNTNVNTTREPVDRKSNYKFKVVARLLSVQENKKLVGFSMQDLSDGTIKHYRIPQVTVLCDKKLVENLILVAKENGTRYLKGNGIIIDQLPETLI